MIATFQRRLRAVAACAFVLTAAPAVSSANITGFGIARATQVVHGAQPLSNPANIHPISRQSSTGPSRTDSLSVIVNADGTLARGPDDSASDNFGIGDYEVFFDRNVSRCVYTATIGDVIPDNPVPGFIVVAPRFQHANGVFVRVFDTTGAFANNSFHLHVSC